MKKENLKTLGSYTARGGFENEKSIVTKFNNWEKDIDAKKWLVIMGYAVDEIENVRAVRLSNKYKTDVQVQITVYLKKTVSTENLSIKLVSNSTGFNQVDKRWVNRYSEMWNIPEDVVHILKLFTGEISYGKNKNLKDKRRMFFNEMNKKNQKKLVNFFSKNKFLIISDILKGRGKYSTDWMMVVLNQTGTGQAEPAPWVLPFEKGVDFGLFSSHKANMKHAFSNRIGIKSTESNQWVLKPINQVINFFSEGAVKITSKGSLKIGRITMQRKGGDAGRETAKMLQFKINPVKLFKDKR